MVEAKRVDNVSSPNHQNHAHLDDIGPSHPLPYKNPYHRRTVLLPTNGENAEDAARGVGNLCFSFRIGGDLDRKAERGDRAEEGDVRVADLPRCGGGPGGV